MPEFDPIEESLPEALRPIRPCPPLKLLLAHKEDVLPENAAAEITGHLEHCGLCRTLLADVEHLSPPGLSKREQELMRRRMPIPEAVDSTKWRWYAVSGAVAAVLLVGAFLGLRARPVQPVQTAQILQPKQSETVTPKQVQPQLEVAKLAPPLDLAPGLALRGSGPSDQPGPDQLAPAFDAYEKNDYSLAADRFDLLAKQFPRADLPMLYLGVTQLLRRTTRPRLLRLRVRTSSLPAIGRMLQRGITLLLLSERIARMPLICCVTCAGATNHTMRNKRVSSKRSAESYASCDIYGAASLHPPDEENLHLKLVVQGCLLLSSFASPN